MTAHRAVIAQQGEAVWVPGASDPQPVSVACHDIAGAWVCSTHHHVSSNNINATAHESDGDHHTTYWLCYEHGPEEA